MLATLNNLEQQELLILPGLSSWSSSFSGMNEFFNGDESRLILKSASGGDSEADSRSIILTCVFSNGEIIGRIRNLDDAIDKEKLMHSLGALYGKPIPQVFSTPVEYI